MSSSSSSIKHVKTRAERTARETAASPAVEMLARLGYVARGVVYALIGLLSLQLALSHRGQVTDQTGAVAYLSAQPFGKLIVILLAVGLIGYALWGFVRALFDPLHRGSDPRGLLERAGFVVSGVSYGALALVALFYGIGVGSASAGKPQDMSAQLLSKPFGVWLVGALGLFWIGGAIGQAYMAYKADFMKDLGGMSAQERTAMERLGRFGYAARAVVFALIGWFLIQSALTANPNQAVGLDGALWKLTNQPNGMVLLSIVALGLLAFGIFSMLCARWIRISHPALASVDHRP